MKLKCRNSKKEKLDFIVIENKDYKESEYRQYSIIDTNNRKFILSCSFSYLKVILIEKTIKSYYNDIYIIEKVEEDIV